jgi:hypothetical protein
MALIIQRKPTVKEFVLQADPEGETKVVIKQATEDENLRRSDLFSESTRVIEMTDDEGDTMQWKQKFNIRRQMRYEAYLTLCAVPGLEWEDGKDVFKTRTTNDGDRLNMNESAFNKAWGKLPAEVIKEIHSYITDVNPQWGSNSGE